MESLIRESERESIQLDYKQGINPSENGKHDLVKLVVGMANTEGGYIIFGINEDKQKGIPTKMEGIDPSVGGQKVDEWLENVINPHISPRVVIRIKTIALETKIALVLWVPQSTRKPHMSTLDNDFRIYRRYNTQSLPASEGELREMYLASNKIERVREDFILKKNLTNVSNKEFGLTTNSDNLLSKLGIENKYEYPIVTLSSCPRFLEEKVNFSSDTFQSWLSKNSFTKIQNQDIEIFRYNPPILEQNSITILRKMGMNDKILEYLEIQRNGFIEQCKTLQLIHSDGNKFVLNLGRLTVALWAFLYYVKNFYQQIDYLDEFSIFMSIRNSNRLELCGLLGLSERGHPYSTESDDLFRYLDITPMYTATTYDPVFPTTQKEQNLSHSVNLTMNNLTDEEIYDIVKNFADRISNAFGLAKAHCYNNDGTFVNRHLDFYNKLLS